MPVSPAFLDVDLGEFEDFAVKFVSEMGFEVEERITAGDGSVYLVAKTTNPMGGKITSLVRAGAYKGNVDEPLVKELEREMRERKAIRGAFITTSDFTSDAVDFARGKPISLINRFQIAESLEGKGITADESTLCFMQEHGLLEKRFMSEDHVFIPGKTRDEVLKYFESKRRKPFLRLGRVSEKIEEVETKYAPVGMFKVTTIEDIREEDGTLGKTEHDDFLFVNLSNADLYYVIRKRRSGTSEYVIESTDNLKDIFDLPDKAREHLMDLLDHGKLPYEKLDDKYLAILEAEKVIRREDAGGRRSPVSDVINVIILAAQEVFDLVLYFVNDITGSGGGVVERHLPDTEASPEKSVVMASIDLPHLHGGIYDLKKFLVMRMVSGLKFKVDGINYSSPQVSELLKSLFSAVYVSPRGIIFMPYFICTYRSQDVKAERRREILIAPKFIPEEAREEDRVKKQAARKPEGLKIDSMPYKIIR